MDRLCVQCSCLTSFRHGLKRAKKGKKGIKIRGRRTKTWEGGRLEGGDKNLNSGNTEIVNSLHTTGQGKPERKGAKAF